MWCKFFYDGHVLELLDNVLQWFQSAYIILWCTVDSICAVHAFLSQWRAVPVTRCTASVEATAQQLVPTRTVPHSLVQRSVCKDASALVATTWPAMVAVSLQRNAILLKVSVCVSTCRIGVFGIVITQYLLSILNKLGFFLPIILNILPYIKGIAQTEKHDIKEGTLINSSCNLK